MVNVRSGDKDTRQFTYTRTKVPLRDTHVLPANYSSSEEEDAVFAPGCTVTFLDGRPGGKVVSRRHGWYRVKVPGNRDLLRVRAYDLYKQRSSQSRIAMGIDPKPKVCVQSYDYDTHHAGYVHYMSIRRRDPYMRPSGSVYEAFGIRI